MVVSGFVVLNLLYGEWLGELILFILFFNDWGKCFKEVWKGWYVILLSSNCDLLCVFKFCVLKDYVMNNGKFECWFVNYVLNYENVV